MVSPAQSMYFGSLQILHLLEDLKLALEMLKDPQEKEALWHQVPGATIACIHDWLEEHLVSKSKKQCIYCIVLLEDINSCFCSIFVLKYQKWLCNKLLKSCFE